MSLEKILIIDDSRVIRARIREMLPQGNFEVLEAQDGAEGLKLIHQVHPNLILMDFLMPRMNGWEVLQQLQQDSNLWDIPLVIMSGRKEEVTEHVTEPFEYFEFVGKPFERNDLVNAIRSAMAKARQRASKPAPVASTSGGSGAEVAELKQRLKTVEDELAALKRQMNQLVTFIKQRLQ